jgi:hypothetical protein
MFGVIFCGAGALADSLVPFKGVLAALAAMIGALDITFDLSSRARDHTLMRHRYFELLADLKAGRRSLEETQDCLDRFNAHEESPYMALYLACWNRAEKEIRGHDARHFEIWVGYRAVKNLLRLPSVDFGKPYPISSAARASSLSGRFLNWWRGTAVTSAP